MIGKLTVKKTVPQQVDKRNILNGRKRPGEKTHGTHIFHLAYNNHHNQPQKEREELMPGNLLTSYAGVREGERRGGGNDSKNLEY